MMTVQEDGAWVDKWICFFQLEGSLSSNYMSNILSPARCVPWITFGHYSLQPDGYYPWFLFQHSFVSNKVKMVQSKSSAHERDI